MNQKESAKNVLQYLRPQDEVQDYREGGYLIFEGNKFFIDKIVTACHGYYVIHQSDSRWSVAKQVSDKSKYSYAGDGFVFLEEDCDIISFMSQLSDK